MKQLSRMLENVEAKYTSSHCPICGQSVWVRPTGLVAAHIRFDNIRGTNTTRNPRPCEGNLKPLKAE